MMALGLLLAVCGELSWLSLVFRSTLFLIPLTRFPGFVWMIAAGFALTDTNRQPARGTVERSPQRKVA
jgi:hypothetical protein